MKFGKKDRDSDFGRDENSELGSIMGGGLAPSYRDELDGNGFRFRDTISELYDDREKEAVFRSSMKKGGANKDFNETYGRMSPEQMKENLNLSFKAQPTPDLTKHFKYKPPKEFSKLPNNLKTKPNPN